MRPQGFIGQVPSPRSAFRSLRPPLCTRRESFYLHRRYARNYPRIHDPRCRNPNGASQASAMSVIVRVATEADIPSIDELLSHSYSVLLKPHYASELLDKVLPDIGRVQPDLVTCGTYYVVVLDGAVVGAGGWTFSAPGGRDSQRRVANVRHVVTDHRHVRKGIARALMERVFADARAAGASRMHCLSTRTAEPFYNAMRFVSVAPIDLTLRNGAVFPAIEMERNL